MTGAVPPDDKDAPKDGELEPEEAAPEPEEPTTPEPEEPTAPEPRAGAGVARSPRQRGR